LGVLGLPNHLKSNTGRLKRLDAIAKAEGTSSDSGKLRGTAQHELRHSRRGRSFAVLQA
jgi:hypothetical protein